MRRITDAAGAAQGVSRQRYTPLEAIKVYPSQAGFRVIIPQASRLFCMEMLAGAPLLMEELTGDLKALIDEKSRWCRMGAQQETGARLPHR